MQKFKNASCMWKNYTWNASTCTCENGKYLGSILDDSVINFHKTMGYW